MKELKASTQNTPQKALQKPSAKAARKKEEINLLIESNCLGRRGTASTTQHINHERNYTAL